MATLKQIKRGLSLRPTYDEVLISYLSGGPDIKKPDRTASFIRESPQYQDLLKTDFLELQKQQNDMLQSQRKNIILKEIASQTGSDVKSVLASESPSESDATQQVQSDFSALTAHSGRVNDMFEEMEDMLDQIQEDKLARQQQMAAKGKADMDAYVGNTQRLADKFIAAKATGYEPVSTTGDKKFDEHIAEGQQLGTLRALPASSSNPPYISELSKNPEAIESFRQSHGLSQAAASSSSGPVQFNIASPRPDRSKSRERPRSAKGTRAESVQPEYPPARRGRPPGSKNYPK